MADPLSQLGVALQASLDAELTKALVVATGTATSVPDSLQSTSHPLVLSGTVVQQTGSDAQSNLVTVQTTAGPVSIALDDSVTATSLPKGAVTLVVQPGDQPAVSILAQRPPPAAITPAPVQTDAATAQVQLAQPQTQAAIPTLTAGQTVTATLLPNTQREAIPATPAPGPAPASASTGQTATTPVQATATLTQTAVQPTYAAPPGPAYVELPQAGTPVTPPLQQASQQPEPQPSALPQLAQPPTQQAQSSSQTILTAPATAETLPETPPAPAASPPPAAQPPQLGLLAAQVEPETTTPAQTAAAPQAQATSQQPPASYAQPPAVPAVQGAAYANEPDTASYLVVQVAAPAHGQASPSTAPQAASVSTPPAPVQPQTAATQPEAANTGPQPQPQFTGTVVAQTPSRQPLLDTPQGGLLLTRPANVEIGSQVTLQRLPQAQAPVQSSPLSAAGPPAPLVMQATQGVVRQAWPALTQLFEALDKDAPSVGAKLAQDLPNLASPGFAKGFAAFLTPGAAPPQQSPANLSVAQAARALPDEQAKLVQALVQQLQDDVVTVGKNAAAPLKADDWRAHLVPLMNGPHPELVQLFVRQHPNDPFIGENDQKPSNTTRFLVEIAPQHVGPVQLDGLLRTLPSQPTRLDLVIRTTVEMGEAATTEMQGLFQTALVSTGLQGSVRFQPGHEHFVQAASGPVHQVDRRS